METVNFGNFAAVRDDGEGVLGKMLYYTLSSVLIDRERLAEICEGINFPYTEKRPGGADAFRSATGDIAESKTVKDAFGALTFKIYCRDNKYGKGIVSRELVKETLCSNSNEYKKLANLTYSKAGGFSYDDLAYDEHIDPLAYCLEAEKLYDLYKTCVGRKQIEGLLDAFVASLSAVKVLAHGKMYFVPRSHMHRLDIFEDFVNLLEENNLHTGKNRAPLDANSMYVVNSEKQRGKMASAFYRAARKEIEEYAERANYFISSGCQSAAVMDRWVLKISALEARKAEYEDILSRELDDLKGEFDSLAYLSQELQIRSKGIKKQYAFAA